MAWETGFSQVDQYFSVQDYRNQKENIRPGGLKNRRNTETKNRTCTMDEIKYLKRSPQIMAQVLS